MRVCVEAAALRAMGEREAGAGSRRAVVLALLPVLALIGLAGCGGGGGGGSKPASPRSDGKVAVAAQTLDLVSDSGGSVGRRLSVPAIMVSPGQDIDLPVSASECSGGAGVVVHLEFDSTVFTCADVIRGEGLPTGPHAAKNVLGKPGYAAIAAASTTGCPAGSATIATFKLKALSTAAPQNAVLKLTAVLAGEHGETLGRTAASGAAAMKPSQVEADSGIIGDLGHTGQPEIGTVVKILRVVAALDPPLPAKDVWKWDCDLSGAVDIGDATKVLRCLIGMDPWPIPCGTATPAGGTITIFGGGVTLDLPAGAVASPLDVLCRYAIARPTDPRLVPGTACDFSPTRQTFPPAVQLTIRYDPASLPAGVSEQSLQLCNVVGGAWQKVSGSRIDTTAHVALGPIHGFGIYGVVGAGPLPPAPSFFFHDGDDPIVFLGDSLTQQRMYTVYIEAFIYSRFPKWHVRFRNAGWNGDTSWFNRRGADFDTALQRDVLSLKPKVVTICYGMNDAKGATPPYTPEIENLPKYVEYETRLTRSCKAAGARVALLTTSPVEGNTPGQPGGSSYNNLLAEFSSALQGVAQNEGVPFADQFTGFLNVLTAGRTSGALDSAPAKHHSLTQDGIHGNTAGHLVMATMILKALGAPSMVSTCTIDATGPRVTDATGCSITNLVADPGGVSFTRTDSALPWYFPPQDEFVLAVPHFDPLGDLSNYSLTVLGLQPGYYNLLIDGKAAATFTQEELAMGANISLKAGCITRQASQVNYASWEKDNYYLTRWRDVQLGGVPEWQGSGPEFEAKKAAELQRLDGLIAQCEARMEVYRKPIPHKFALVKSQT